MLKNTMNKKTESMLEQAGAYKKSIMLIAFRASGCNKQMHVIRLSGTLVENDRTNALLVDITCHNKQTKQIYKDMQT